MITHKIEIQEKDLFVKRTFWNNEIRGRTYYYVVAIDKELVTCRNTVTGLSREFFRDNLERQKNGLKRVGGKKLTEILLGHWEEAVANV
ncbi:hypothetical protein V6R21_20365 [Limibacter armeniacum]|uniref:hypothetical protein n=1 Tax=Limibacter armeniacum TaxID=466084 RepID=UPI002FE621DB